MISFRSRVLVCALALQAQDTRMAVASRPPKLPVIPRPAGYSTELLGPDPIDVTVEMLGEKEVAIRQKAAEVGSAVATNASPAGPAATIGEEFVITLKDLDRGTDYDENFVTVLYGTRGIILLEKAAYESFNDTHYFIPNGGAMCGDSEDIISQDQLVYMLDEFDNNIYPTVASIFGEPLPRGNEGNKTWALVFNIRDDAFYDCSQIDEYTAGYFSGSTNAVNNKNIMHIDSRKWEDRVGQGALRPFLYERTFAHEFEHLVHFDIDPDEPSWVDEGLADLAAFKCGYGHPAINVATYLGYHPVVSLTNWNGGLAGYGASYLFQLYLYEQFGGNDFTSALVKEQANGIEGIENTLGALLYKETFDDVFNNWMIANYLDDTRKSGGKYGYNALDIGSADTLGRSIEFILDRFWQGPECDVPCYPPYAAPFRPVPYPKPRPYTAHYFRFKTEDNANAWIHGGSNVFAPSSGSYQWYSGVDRHAWRSFYQSFDIPAGGATLNFYTFFENEEDYDYGYVEVHDKDRDEWFTLNAEGTVDAVAHPTDNPNTPSGRKPTDYENAGRWHAFTGSSGGWIPVSMDLLPFAGRTIDLYFTTWQDVGDTVTFHMMFVDDISISELNFTDDVEDGEGSWKSNGWQINDGVYRVHPNAFGVEAIDTKVHPEPAGNNAMSFHGVNSITVDEETQSGTSVIQKTPADPRRVQVAIITNHARHSLSTRTHYEFGVDLKEV